MSTPDRAEDKKISVSIVVPCRNEIRWIREFLDSVLRQDAADMKLEVLIADGMSEDGTRAILEEYARTFPALRVIENHARIVSTGLNAAIRQATGEIIIRMDAHSVYPPDYIRSCVEVLTQTNAANVGGPALTRSEGYVGQAIAHAFEEPFARGGAKSRDSQYEGPVETVPYGCWRKSTLERIGLFDENLVRSQDYDLNRRIVGSGGTVWQSPKITSWYRPRSSLSGLCRQYFQYGFWKVVVMSKRRGAASVRNLAPGLCAIAAIFLIAAAIVASLSGLVALRNIFLYGWVSLAVLYVAASSAASVVASSRCGWRFFPIFPIVFAVYHFSYALGSLVGFSRGSTSLSCPGSIEKLLTEITR